MFRSIYDQEMPQPVTAGFYLSLLFMLSGFYIELNVWGSLGLNFEYDGGPIIEIGGPIFLYKLRILEGSTSFREGSV